MPNQKEHLRNMIRNYTRRLQKLKEQQAVQGQSVEPRILLEIEDIEAELERLRAAYESPEDMPDGPGSTISAFPAAGAKDEAQSNAGGIPFGNQAGVHGDVFTGGKRVINTGGGAYIEGGVQTGGGDFVGRDQFKSGGLSAADIARLFEPIYVQVNAHPALSPEDKSDLKTEVQELQAEVVKGDRADESFLSRRLRNIKRLAPDILEVVTATLASPTAGFSAVVTKVAQRIKE